MATYLTTAEVPTVLRLLGVLRDDLQNVIDSNTPPGVGTDELSRFIRAEVRQARRDLKATQALITKLERRVRNGDEQRAQLAKFKNA
jgi:hypothetical protein